MRCISTKFGVDSSSRFPFRALTHTEPKSRMLLITNKSTIAGVGNYAQDYMKHIFWCIIKKMLVFPVGKQCLFR